MLNKKKPYATTAGIANGAAAIYLPLFKFGFSTAAGNSAISASVQCAGRTRDGDNQTVLVPTGSGFGSFGWNEDMLRRAMVKRDLVAISLLGFFDNTEKKMMIKMMKSVMDGGGAGWGG